MYKIIGADRREYGPVNADELRRWIQEGRANAQSQILVEGSADWRPLNSFPEFASLLAAAPPLPPPPLVTTSFSRGVVPRRKQNGMAIAGLVFSLLGILCCGVGIFPLLGLIFSIIGLMQTNRDPWQSGKNMAVAGVILSLIGLLTAVVIWIIIFLAIGQNPDFHV